MSEAEEGTVIIIVVITSLVLFAMSAFVIDIGALLQERRVLQNGADASAFAIAEECGAGDCGDALATADDYADSNADDGVTSIEDLCGHLVDDVDECSDPPDVPEGAGYVRVTTKTAHTDGSDQVPFRFARLLGNAGATAHAQATAAWGGPSSLTSELPLTMSECEFDAYTNGGADLNDPPPYDTSGYPSEVVIYFHDTTGASPCESGPAGSDLPGGFGWLNTSTDCYATSDTEGWFDDSTGRPPPASCDADELRALVGTVVHVPVFDQTNELGGSNGQYHMAYFASFYVTGYSLLGNGDAPFREESVVTGEYPCSGQATCISGFFVEDAGAVSGTIGGPSMGVFVVQLIG